MRDSGKEGETIARSRKGQKSEQLRKTHKNLLNNKKAAPTNTVIYPSPILLVYVLQLVSRRKNKTEEVAKEING